MRFPNLFVISSIMVAMFPSIAKCQVSQATEAAAQELMDVMLREGGREAAGELFELGGAAAVRELLGRAGTEGGEELIKRVVQYGGRYGPAALKAIEPSPSRMVRTLDRVSPELVRPAIQAAAREPELTSHLVSTYGKDALEVAARQPGVGASLVEKLGSDGISLGRNLTTDEAVTLARYADNIAALPGRERNRLMDAITKAPAKVLDYLERHPKVLLTAGGVAAVIAAKDNLLGGTVPSTSHHAPPAGLIERVICRLGNRFAGPVTVVIAIIVAGIFCYVLIQLRSAWNLKAIRLRREQAFTRADVARPSKAKRPDSRL